MQSRRSFMNANMNAAGIAPEAIDTIVISHFHPDHIDGIKTKDGDKVFHNAEILVPEPEWAFWMDDGNMSRAASPTVHRYFLNARGRVRTGAVDVDAAIITSSTAWRY
jgi:glyoxylase-like metal-dependent hydrolase (beta-lactamase superfamily II)